MQRREQASAVEESRVNFWMTLLDGFLRCDCGKGILVMRFVIISSYIGLGFAEFDRLLIGSLGKFDPAGLVLAGLGLCSPPRLSLPVTLSFSL
jgi:hypothetical protein